MMHEMQEKIDSQQSEIQILAQGFQAQQVKLNNLVANKTAEFSKIIVETQQSSNGGSNGDLNDVIVQAP